MKKEELKETLDLWRLKTQQDIAHIWQPTDEEAFQQIRALIEQLGQVK